MLYERLIALPAQRLAHLDVHALLPHDPPLPAHLIHVTLNIPIFREIRVLLHIVSPHHFLTVIFPFFHFSRIRPFEPLRPRTRTSSAFLRFGFLMITVLSFSLVRTHFLLPPPKKIINQSISTGGKLPIGGERHFSGHGGGLSVEVNSMNSKF